MTNHETPTWLNTSATKEHIDDWFGAYSATFHESFFILDGPSISVSDEEVYRWLNWCVFYGRPRDEYPDAEKDWGHTTATVKAIALCNGLFHTHKTVKVHIQIPRWNTSRKSRKNVDFHSNYHFRCHLRIFLSTVLNAWIFRATPSTSRSLEIAFLKPIVSNKCCLIFR